MPAERFSTRIVTSAEARALDSRAIRQAAMPPELLMENAGRAIAEVCSALLDGVPDRRVLVLAGKGNNGGDGLCAARWLKFKGADPRVLLLAEPEDLRGEARKNYEWAVTARVPVQPVLDRRALEREFQAAQPADLLLDALLGTGLKGEVTGYYRDGIELLNRAARRVPVVSADVPSGLDADSGRPLGVAVVANVTVTMGFYKPGLLLYPGAAFAGAVFVAPLGYPSSFADEIRRYAVTADLVRDLLPLRPPWIHKGTAGKVLLVAGSKEFTGAAVLASRAAMRSGAGLATLAFPRSLYRVLASQLVEVMKAPCAEAEPGALGMKALPEIRKKMNDADALVLGPGLGRHPETRQLITELAAGSSVPLILDADGLFPFSGKLAELRKVRAPFIFTPHAGELARLVSSSAAEVEDRRLEVTRSAAAKAGGVLVFKGARTTAGTPDGTLYLNTTGNEGMASGGVGDVLSGILGALLAGGLSPEHAAVVGVYVHGRAGDLAAARVGKRPLIASDLLARIPRVFRELEGE